MGAASGGEGEGASGYPASPAHGCVLGTGEPQAPGWWWWLCPRRLPELVSGHPPPPAVFDNTLKPALSNASWQLVLKHTKHTYLACSQRTALGRHCWAENKPWAQGPCKERREVPVPLPTSGRNPWHLLSKQYPGEVVCQQGPAQQLASLGIFSMFATRRTLMF